MITGLAQLCDLDHKVQVSIRSKTFATTCASEEIRSRVHLNVACLRSTIPLGRMKSCSECKDINGDTRITKASTDEATPAYAIDRV